MGLPLLIFAVVASFLALGLSGVSLTLTWVQRAQDPRTAHLEGELAELSDKLYSFMKREAARARRAPADENDSQPPAAADAYSVDPRFDAAFRRKYAGR